MEDYYFNDGHHAMSWATEILRHRRFAKGTSAYREMEVIDCDDDTAGESASEWRGEYGDLPTDSDDKLSLALKVYQLFASLDEELQMATQLRYWGDYINETHLAKMQRHQQIMRATGKKVRLSYRYSYRQIGVMLNIDHKTAAARVNHGLRKLEQLLVEAGLMQSFAK